MSLEQYTEVFLTLSKKAEELFLEKIKEQITGSDANKELVIDDFLSHAVKLVNDNSDVLYHWKYTEWDTKRIVVQCIENVFDNHLSKTENPDVLYFCVKIPFTTNRFKLRGKESFNPFKVDIITKESHCAVSKYSEEVWCNGELSRYGINYIREWANVDIYLFYFIEALISSIHSELCTIHRGRSKCGIDAYVTLHSSISIARINLLIHEVDELDNDTKYEVMQLCNSRHTQLLRSISYVVSKFLGRDSGEFIDEVFRSNKAFVTAEFVTIEKINSVKTISLSDLMFILKDVLEYRKQQGNQLWENV